MSTPLFANRPEDLTVTTEEGVPESTLKEILKKISEVLFRDRQYWKWVEAIETRRHGPLDPGRQHEPDFGAEVRRAEGYEPPFRMGDYHERPEKSSSWKDWMLGLVSLVIVGWLANISLKMDKLTEVVVNQSIQGRQIAQINCTLYKLCQ